MIKYCLVVGINYLERMQRIAAKHRTKVKSCRDKVLGQNYDNSFKKFRKLQILSKRRYGLRIVTFATTLHCRHLIYCASR